MFGLTITNTLFYLLSALGSRAAPSLLPRDSAGPLYHQNWSLLAYDLIARFGVDNNYTHAVLGATKKYQKYLQSLIDFEGDDSSSVSTVKATAFNVISLEPGTSQIKHDEVRERNNSRTDIWWSAALYRAAGITGFAKNPEEKFTMPDMPIEDAMTLLTGVKPLSLDPSKDENMKKITGEYKEEYLETPMVCHTKMGDTHHLVADNTLVLDRAFRNNGEDNIGIITTGLGPQVVVAEAIKKDCTICWYWDPTQLNSTSVYKAPTDDTDTSNADSSSATSSGSSTIPSAASETSSETTTTSGTAASTEASTSTATSASSTTASETSRSSTFEPENTESSISGSETTANPTNAPVMIQNSLPKITTVTVTTTEQPSQVGAPDEPTKAYISLTTEIVTVKASAR